MNTYENLYRELYHLMVDAARERRAVHFRDTHAATPAHVSGASGARTPGNASTGYPRRDTQTAKNGR